MRIGMSLGRADELGRITGVYDAAVAAPPLRAAADKAIPSQAEKSFMSQGS